jgi:hypothetical protein
MAKFLMRTFTCRSTFLYAFLFKKNAPPGELAGAAGPGNGIKEEAVRTVEADSARGQAPEELRPLVGVAVEAVRQPLAHVPREQILCILRVRKQVITDLYLNST